MRTDAVDGNIGRKRRKIWNSGSDMLGLDVEEFLADAYGCLERASNVNSDVARVADGDSSRMGLCHDRLGLDINSDSNKDCDSVCGVVTLEERIVAESVGNSTVDADCHNFLMHSWSNLQGSSSKVCSQPRDVSIVECRADVFNNFDGSNCCSDSVPDYAAGSVEEFLSQAHANHVGNSDFRPTIDGSNCCSDAVDDYVGGSVEEFLSEAHANHVGSSDFTPAIGGSGNILSDGCLRRMEVENFYGVAYENQSTIPSVSSRVPAISSREEHVVQGAKLSFVNGLPYKVRRNPTSIFKPNELIILPDVPPCHHCSARRFFLKPPGFCCCAGDILLKPVVLPPDIVELLTGSSAMCKHFRTYIRLYNGNFAYTTMGVNNDPGLASKKQCGIYTFRVCGQIHHYLGDLQPSEVPKPGLELYFYDPQNELQNRLNTCDGLNKDVMARLLRALEGNPYAAFLRSLHRVVDLDRYYISINCSSALDQRTHNSPTSSDVAAIWLDDDTSGGNERFQRDIRVYAKSGRSFVVREQFSCFDTLSYPLMFPRGEQGWHPNILKVDKGKNKFVGRDDNNSNVGLEANIVDLNNEGEFGDMEGGPTVTARQYYCYKLQMRPDDKSYQLSFGRLLQQFVVDMYIKIESMRLLFIRRNQAKFRVDFYQGIVDSIAVGFAEGRKVGKRVLLPASFIGGPRNMCRRYVDAMTLVRRFGKPDIFLTMTCNSKWPEIKSVVPGYEESMNRPDLAVRVFRAKVELMKKRITVDSVFGEVASLVYVIEYQKRGLPHAHFLVILKAGSKLLTPEAYDAVVCAEIPNKRLDPQLHAAVARHMFHGPCGPLKPKNSCLKGGNCRNRYPKNFCEYTTHGEQTYPLYRRREIPLSEFVKVDKHFLDNRWVVPYNPRLLREFNCHMNVEV